MNTTQQILQDLIAFNTVSSESNLDIIDYIDTFLSQRGFRTTRISDETQLKSGLYAVLGQDTGGLLLSAHTDVVPAAGQAWTRDPFALSQEGDKLYGRGTTDMKGYVACALQAADKASRITLQEPLKLVFSYDEEVGCIGMRDMIAPLAKLVGEPRLCIVGEPTHMQIATGQKGKVALTAECFGQNGHSALAPEFVNAIHLAADFVSEIQALQTHYAHEGAKDNDYDIPYTTFHVGTLNGGRALNIVPDSATIEFEYRYLPADNESELYHRVVAAADRVSQKYREQWCGARIDIKRKFAYPGMEISPAHVQVQNLLPTVKDTTLTKVPFGSEAGYIADLGVPTVICGPGSMAGQGHKPDEYITLQQLRACEEMMDSLLVTLQ